MGNLEARITCVKERALEKLDLAGKAVSGRKRLEMRRLWIDSNRGTGCWATWRQEDTLGCLLAVVLE